MRTTLTILLSSLLLCGCSKRPAIELVVAGKDIKFGGQVLHIDKRDGSSIQGIRLVTKALDGKETTIIAETGAVSEGSDRNAISITLEGGQIQSSQRVASFLKMGPINLVR